MKSFKDFISEETLNELVLSVVGDSVQDKSGTIWFPIEIKYFPEDVKSGLVTTFEKAARKKGYLVTSNTPPINPKDRFGSVTKLFFVTLTFGPTPGPFSQILISNKAAKNEQDAIKKIERLAALSKLKNPFIRAAKGVKKLLQKTFKV